jgi:hypothetical protein
MKTRFALLTSRTISDPIELDYEVHENRSVPMKPDSLLSNGDENERVATDPAFTGGPQEQVFARVYIPGLLFPSRLESITRLL